MAFRYNLANWSMAILWKEFAIERWSLGTWTSQSCRGWKKKKPVIFLVKCSQFERKLRTAPPAPPAPPGQRNHTLIFVRTSAAEPVGVRLLRANIFIRHPESVAPSCAGDFAPSKAQQSGGNCRIIDVHSARLSADRTLRTCPRDAEHRRPQVCAGCLFPHVKVISCDSQQAGGKSGMAVAGAHMCAGTDN